MVKTQAPRLFFVCFHHMFVLSLFSDLFVFVCFFCFLSLFIQIVVRFILKGEFDKINKEKKHKKTSYAYNLTKLLIIYISLLQHIIFFLQAWRCLPLAQCLRAYWGGLFRLPSFSALLLWSMSETFRTPQAVLTTACEQALQFWLGANTAKKSFFAYLAHLERTDVLF